APEEIVSEINKEMKAAGKRGNVDEAKIKKGVYNRAKSDAQRKSDLIWSPEVHAELVRGEPAELRSKTKITAEQVLAIRLPDLAAMPASPTGAVELRMAEAEASLPVSMRLDIVTVIDNLLLDDRERKVQHKMLAQLVENMRAIGVLDEHGKQVSGDMIRQLQGMDGLLIFYILLNHQLDYVELHRMVEYPL